jgi:hypothetical protein
VLEVYRDWAVEQMERHGKVAVWVVDDTGMPRPPGRRRLGLVVCLRRLGLGHRARRIGRRERGSENPQDYKVAPETDDWYISAESDNARDSFCTRAGVKWSSSDEGCVVVRQEGT